MIIAVGGKEKSCKTSIALSLPKPIIVFEFDIGTVERGLRWKDNKGLKFATYMRDGKDVVALDKLDKNLDVYVFRYPKPLAFGTRDVRNTWRQFITDFLQFLESKTIPSGSIDTASSCWNMCHSSFLQGLPATEYGPRVSLKQIEYSQPNSIMASLLDGVRNCDVAAHMYKWPCGNKHLFLAHHFTGVYAPQLTPKGIETLPTGDLKLDGFRRTSDLIDIELWLEVRQVEINQVIRARPVGKFKLSAYSLDMVGQEMVEPTFDKIQNMAEKMAAF